MEAFDKAAKDSRVMSGGPAAAKNMIPGVTSAYNKELEAKMGPTFADVEGTVRQAAMDNMAHNTHPQAFDNDNTILRKREALKAYLASKESAPTARGYGIDLSKFSSTSSDPRMRFTPQQQQWYNWSVQHPEDPKSKAFMKKVGL